jgi:ATP-dependent protease ClpP protease subunit/uncharacterized small protein (DUF1192 family)
MNEFLNIDPQNKSGKIKLNDIVMQPVMDRLIGEIGKIFGAKAAACGDYSGELTNCIENAIDTLEIEIHSPGGSVLDGYTLYNEIMALRSRGVHVTATINSLAASMASVIAMAADVIRMVPQGRMMIHEVSQGVRGNAQELRKAADMCEGMSNQIAQIYSDRTGKPVDEMRAMMQEETWMDAKTALQNGFINEVFDIRPASPKTKGMNILKVLFPGNEAEISKVEATLAEVDSLRNDIAMFTSEVATLKAEAAAKDQTIAEHVASIASRDEQITELTGKVSNAESAISEKDAKITELTAEVETAKQSAANIAIEKMAAIGQPEALVIEGGEDKSQKTVTRQQFDAMDHFERGKFIGAGGKLKD